MPLLFRLVFRICYRCYSKRGFAAMLSALAMATGAVALFPEGRESIAKALHFNASAEAPKDATEDVAAKLQESRERLADLQGEYAQVNAEVASQYQALTASRKSLNTGDQAAVHKFNQQAAAYQVQNARLKQLANEIQAANQTVSSLLDERSKANVQAIKHVVLYTTSTCPYCKAAKNYLAQKGVDYREINIEESKEGLEEFKRLGGRGVPLIIVGDKRMEGFSPQGLDALL